MSGTDFLTALEDARFNDALYWRDVRRFEKYGRTKPGRQGGDKTGQWGPRRGRRLRPVKLAEDWVKLADNFRCVAPAPPAGRDWYVLSREEGAQWLFEHWREWRLLTHRSRAGVDSANDAISDADHAQYYKGYVNALYLYDQRWIIRVSPDRSLWTLTTTTDRKLLQLRFGRKKDRHGTIRDRGELFLVRLPKDLHSEVKVAAAQRGETINAFVERVVMNKVTSVAALRRQYPKDRGARGRDKSLSAFIEDLLRRVLAMSKRGGHEYSGN